MKLNHTCLITVDHSCWSWVLISIPLIMSILTGGPASFQMLLFISSENDTASNNASILWRESNSKGEELYLHLGRYKDTGNMYLYSASVKPPKNMEPLQ